MPAFVELWEQHPLLSLPAALTQRLQQQRLRHDAAGLASALRQLGTGAQPSYWERLRELRVPTVVLAGNRDAKFTGLATRLQKGLPQSELRLLDCGHVIHLEQPEAFRGALR